MHIYEWTCENSATGETITVQAPDADWPEAGFIGSCAEAMLNGCGVSFDRHNHPSPAVTRGSVVYEYLNTVEQWLADERDGTI